jgi:hypothetical protein
MEPIDIDNDALNEMLVAGYNPVLDRAVAIIIDPTFMDGASPRHARIEIPNHDRDIARYYIQFPESPLLVPFNRYRATRLVAELFNGGHFFSVIVKSRYHQIRFDFDESLSSTGATEYRIRQGATRGNLLKEDWIEDDQSLYTDQIAELIAGVRYWDGEQWQPHPVENRSYERARAEAAGRTGAAR